MTQTYKRSNFMLLLLDYELQLTYSNFGRVTRAWWPKIGGWALFVLVIVIIYLRMIIVYDVIARMYIKIEWKKWVERLPEWEWVSPLSNPIEVVSDPYSLEVGGWNFAVCTDCRPLSLKEKAPVWHINIDDHCPWILLKIYQSSYLFTYI